MGALNVSDRMTEPKKGLDYRSHGAGLTFGRMDSIERYAICHL